MKIAHLLFFKAEIVFIEPVIVLQIQQNGEIYFREFEFLMIIQVWLYHLSAFISQL